MAIGATNLTTFTSGVNDTSIVTTSISPTGNRLILLSVLSSSLTLDPNTPTATGNGITWVQMGTAGFDSVATPRSRLTLFRGMVASPSSGAVTIDFGGQNQESRSASIDEFSGVPTGSNGANAVGTAVVLNDGSHTNPSSYGPTLAAFANSESRAYAVGGADGNGLSTLDPLEGATQLAELQVNGAPLQMMNVMWTVDADTTPTWEGSAGGRAYASIGVEIKSSSTVVVLTFPSETDAPQALAGITETAAIVQALESDSVFSIGATDVVSGLVATAISSTEIDLVWDAFAGATGYDIERDGVVIQEFLPNITAFLDSGLTPNTSYSYRVRAIV